MMIQTQKFLNTSPKFFGVDLYDLLALAILLILSLVLGLSYIEAIIFLTLIMLLLKFLKKKFTPFLLCPELIKQRRNTIDYVQFFQATQR
jgi:hypothetical protein